MMKKSMSLMLVLMLMGAFLIPTVGHAADGDLTTQQKYDALAAKGIFSGINGEAALDQNMNRAQFARVAALILGLEGIGSPDTKVVTEKPFRDVELGSWYVEEIAAVKEDGLFVGYTDGTFNPNGDMTVQELAVVVVGLLGLEPVEDAKVEGAADWAAGYIQAIIDSNINFPTEYTRPATRGELADISFQTDNLITAAKEAEGSTPEPSPEPEPEPSPEPSSPPSPSPSPSIVALNLINNAAASENWTSVTVSTFSVAGITGVVASNITDVQNALEEDGNAPWTVLEIQTIVDVVINDSVIQAAISAINNAAAFGDWTNVTVSTFSDAGITGVVASNITDVQNALEEDGNAPWTVLEIQTIVDVVINDSVIQAAISAINNAAAFGDWTNVTVSTFSDAGITGVTSEYIDGIQGVLQDYDYPNSAQPKDKDEIQTIVNETINLNLINNYFGYGYGDVPSKQTFELAGLTGVTDSNLADLLLHLQSAYGGGIPGPGPDPGGPGPGGPGSGSSLTAMSTKQDIQTEINNYLNIQ